MTRDDGRGHWPRGKRRHETDGDAARDTLDALRLLLDLRASRGHISRRVLAAHMRVSDRTIRRWLSGEDLPAASALTRISSWIRAQSHRLP